MQVYHILSLKRFEKQNYLKSQNCYRWLGLRDMNILSRFSTVFVAPVSVHPSVSLAVPLSVHNLRRPEQHDQTPKTSE